MGPPSGAQYKPYRHGPEADGEERPACARGAGLPRKKKNAVQHKENSRTRE